MRGWRCTECDEVRWTLIASDRPPPTSCPVCGARMVFERRLPGSPQGRVPASGERRDVWRPRTPSDGLGDGTPSQAR
ncbi:MAG: hypothetical protein M3296_04995 [Actinomycetota bacterium]|nr:hypothetical protein [Actinomycetota bacterium]